METLHHYNINIDSKMFEIIPDHESMKSVFVGDGIPISDESKITIRRRIMMREN
jgi:hypothetical protein